MNVLLMRIVLRLDALVSFVFQKRMLVMFLVFVFISQSMNVIEMLCVDVLMGIAGGRIQKLLRNVYKGLSSWYWNF